MICLSLSIFSSSWAFGSLDTFLQIHTVKLQSNKLIALEPAREQPAEENVLRSQIRQWRVLLLMHGFDHPALGLLLSNLLFVLHVLSKGGVRF